MRSTISRCATGVAAAIAAGFAAVPSALAQDAPSLAALRAGWATPPQSARVRCYWWWLNGNTDERTITHDLEEMARQGFGGALLVDADGASQLGNKPVPAGPTFASPAWQRLYIHALHEAARLGLEISLNITSGWNLGGPHVTPEHAAKILTWERRQVRGGGPIAVDPPVPPSRDGLYRDIAVLAYPLHHGAALSQPMTGDGNETVPARSAAVETGFSMPDATPMLVPPGAPADTPLADVHDVTAQVHDGRLEWTAPPGDWEVLRIGYTDSPARVSTASGAWQGRVIDYLDHNAFDWYWNDTVAPLLAAAKPYVGRSLKYLVTDSWELGGINWTPAFREQFRRRRGYDPVAYLPAVAGRIVQDGDTTTRFLADLRRTVADLVVAEHYDVFAAHARAHGLGIHPESGGPHGAPIDALETFRSAAFPQTEYWGPNPHRPTDVQRFFTKEAAAAANIYGLPFVAQEGMTTIGIPWTLHLADDLKPAYDQALTEGMTRLFWHEFTSSPAATGLPGQEYFAGTHLNPKINWWDDARPMFDYMARTSFLLEQGLPVNDALYYYGDNVPNFVRLKADDPAHVLPGYDYDVTNLDALTRTISLDGGRITGPKGMSWRLLVLPRSRRLSLPLLRRIEAFVRAGGTVVGERPTGATGLTSETDRRAFDAIAGRMWQGCAAGTSRRYGAGTLRCDGDGRAALTALGIAPDFVAPAASGLDYIHRRTAAADIYFVRNGAGHPVAATVRLRVAARSAQLWDPVSATIVPLAAAKAGPDVVEVALSLAADGSAFVVLPRDGNDPASSDGAAKRPSPVASLDGPWTVAFEPERGAPAGILSWPRLTDWSASSDPGIRYFSGKATYRTTLALTADQARGPLFLRFDQVRETGAVTINGHAAGTVWAKPYRLRVDPLLHAGTNTIEVRVANLWINRIVGDLQPGTTRRIARTNITVVKPDQPLAVSGIIGSVTIDRE